MPKKQLATKRLCHKNTLPQKHLAAKTAIRVTMLQGGISGEIFHRYSRKTKRILADMLMNLLLGLKNVETRPLNLCYVTARPNSGVSLTLIQKSHKVVK